MTEKLVGSQLGKYQVRASLGKGGMGMVYMGYDPQLDRKVAIKVLAPHLVWDEGFVERFLREARAAARIKHANIVTVYDVGQEQERFYFVMEYLEGQTLSAYIRQRGGLPTSEVLSILHPLADALDYAHQHGLVHRDIKPGNIMLGKDLRVTLTDFGIARAAEETRLTTTGTLMGTPEYMSPEQAWGEEVGYQTDLYSLAVVAYEMLSGRVPFSGTTPHAVLYKQIHEPPPPIRQARPELPEGVEAVLSHALDKAPDKRYATATAFVRELETALAGKPVAAPEEAPTELVAGKPGPPAEEAPHGSVAGVPQVAPEEAPTELVSEKSRALTEEAPTALVSEQPGTPAPREIAPTIDDKAPAEAPPPAASARQKAAARRRVPTLLWVLGALGVLAILAGVIGIVWFGSGDSGGPAPTPGPQAAVEPTATRAPAQPTSTRPPAEPPVVEEPPCEDPGGCVVIRPDQPVQIGAMLYLSEEGRDVGVATMRGIEMAIEARGQLLDHPIRLMMQDAGCNPDRAIEAAEALASLPGLVGVIGPTCSNSVIPAGEILCPQNIPLISPSSSAPELTSPDRPDVLRCFLRTSMLEDAYAQAVSEFAWSIGVRRAATIADTSFLSEILANSFAEGLRERGGEIVAQEVLGPESPEAAPAMERVARGEPQLIYLPVYVERGAEITRLAREIPQLGEVALVGADGMFTGAYLGAAGEAALGTFLSAPDLEVVGPAYLEYLAQYEEIYREPPRAPFGAAAHDAAMIIFAAIEDVAQRLDDGTLIIGRQALLERLFTIRNFRGVTGNLSCTPNGNCGNPSAAIYEIVNPDPAQWHPGASPDNNPRRIWP